MNMKDISVLPLPLTTNERHELDRLEAILREGLPTFYAVGDALVAICNQKLYRADYPTFEAYCAQKWNIGRASAYRMIDAANVKKNLSPLGDTIPLPQNEAQVRALKAAPPEKQADIWQKAQSTAPGGKVTANHISQVIQMEIPAPDPEPEPVAAPVHQVSVFVLHEQPRPNLIPTTPIYENRSDWTCSTCQYHFENTFGFFYASGRSLCRACAVKSDPCAVCKSAHYRCNGCCDTCKHPCTLQQDCRLKDELELEPEPACTLAPSVWYICDFCGKTTQQAYNTFRDGNIKASICTDCTKKALHELLDPHDLDVIAETQAIEHTPSEPPFECSAYRDRMKLLEAGLRVFRVDEHTRTLKEFKPCKTTEHEGIDPKSLGSWQKFEQFPTKAAVKRRIQELDRDDHIIFESRL